MYFISIHILSSEYKTQIGIVAMLPFYPVAGLFWPHVSGGYLPATAAKFVFAIHLPPAEAGRILVDFC